MHSLSNRKRIICIFVVSDWSQNILNEKKCPHQIEYVDFNEKICSYRLNSFLFSFPHLSLLFSPSLFSFSFLLIVSPSLFSSLLISSPSPPLFLVSSCPLSIALSLSHSLSLSLLSRLSSIFLYFNYVSAYHSMWSHSNISAMNNNSVTCKIEGSIVVDLDGRLLIMEAINHFDVYLFRNVRISWKIIETGRFIC